MKRLIILLFIICGFSPLIWAVDGCNQERLSPEEFRAKQKAFIIEKAGLTKEEAAKFFPVYFELQDKKKALNDKAWGLIRKGKDDKTTEAQYAEIMCQLDNVPICQLAALCFHRIIGTLTHCPIGTLFKAFFHWHIGTLFIIILSFLLRSRLHPFLPMTCL